MGIVRIFRPNWLCIFKLMGEASTVLQGTAFMIIELLILSISKALLEIYDISIYDRYRGLELRMIRF